MLIGRVHFDSGCIPSYCAATVTRCGEFAKAVEDAGFDVLTIPDHLVPSAPPFAGAAAAAMATDAASTSERWSSTTTFGIPSTPRESPPPSPLISSGRFELGLGAGHMKSEYDAAGLPFDCGGTRVSRLIEAARTDPARCSPASPSTSSGSALPRCVPMPGRTDGAFARRASHCLIGGNGTRVLQLAGRIADIVGLAGLTHDRDATETRTVDALRRPPVWRIASRW